MKKSELKQMIKEEYKKILTESKHAMIFLQKKGINNQQAKIISPLIDEFIDIYILKEILKINQNNKDITKYGDGFENAINKVVTLIKSL